jgi:hypothetical protein
MDNIKSKLYRIVAEGKFEKNKTYVLSVKHDHWCRIFKRGKCNCDPDVIPIVVTDGKQES